MPEDENQGSNTPANQAQPGQVIAPGGSVQPAQPAEAQPQNSAPPPVVSQPQPISPPPVSQPEQPQASQTSENPDSVTWMASEYIAHEKNVSWYMGLALVGVIAAALLYLITRDFVSSAVALFGAFMLGFYGGRTPRQLTYELNNQGLIIGNDKQFSYDMFRTFSIVPEGVFSSIRFVPHKRFGVPITVYYGPDDEDKILNVLSAHLPIEEHRVDAIDRLMRRVRF